MFNIFNWSSTILRLDVNEHADFNPFVPNAAFFCPLKTSENLTAVFLMFSGGRERVHCALQFADHRKHFLPIFGQDKIIFA